MNRHNLYHALRYRSKGSSKLCYDKCFRKKNRTESKDITKKILMYIIMFLKFPFVLISDVSNTSAPGKFSICVMVLVNKLRVILIIIFDL